MIKTQEAVRADSCWNKAMAQEMVFVLLARDPAAPAAIRAWIGERLRLGKNQPGDPQMVEAEACANHMETTKDGMTDAESQRRMAEALSKNL